MKRKKRKRPQIEKKKRLCKVQFEHKTPQNLNQHFKTKKEINNQWNNKR